MTDKRPVGEEGGTVPGAQHAEAQTALDVVRLELAEVRESRKRLVLSADAERRDIERALHDGAQQRLVGLLTNLELGARSMKEDPSAAERLLAEVGSEARQAMEEMRSLAERISPPLLEAGGLAVALRAAAARADRPARIDVRVDAPCPPEIAGTVYACCLDLLERGTAGTPVAITVRSDGEAIAFDVVSHGDPDADLIHLRDRVEALGGRLTVRSGPGGEIQVAGSLPRS